MAITWNGTAWALSTVYPMGARIVSNGGVYKCTTPGISAGGGVGPTGTGSAITDGSCVWAYQGVPSGTVVDIAPDMASGLTPLAQITILAIVEAQVLPANWGTLTDAGSLYLAAHLGKLNLLRGAGQITTESAGPLSVGYSTSKGINGSLGLTAYGAEYLELLKLLPSSLGTVI